MNIFSESIKQTVFYIFNLLNKSVQHQDKSKEDPTESEHDDPQLDDMSESDVILREYSLRERKTINYKV